MRGHRTLPHTADVRLEAWAPTIPECIAEAVLAMVEGFADLDQAGSEGTERVHLEVGAPEDQLVTVLDEVIYLMETTGRIPRSVETGQDETGPWLGLGMTGTANVSQIGAVPKAVSLHDLRFDHRPGGWACGVTLDV